MLTQQIRLADNKFLEIKVSEDQGCVTVSQQFVDDGVKAMTKTCTVTCHTGKSYTWTCPDNKSCSGDCSAPDRPTGSCS